MPRMLGVRNPVSSVRVLSAPRAVDQCVLLSKYYLLFFVT